MKYINNIDNVINIDFNNVTFKNHITFNNPKYTEKELQFIYKEKDNKLFGFHLSYDLPYAVDVFKENNITTINEEFEFRISSIKDNFNNKYDNLYDYNYENLNCIELTELELYNFLNIYLKYCIKNNIELDQLMQYIKDTEIDTVKIYGIDIIIPKHKMNTDYEKEIKDIIEKSLEKNGYKLYGFDYKETYFSK